ncbi:MAG: hypothetical protein RSE91_02360 [Bacilli bacterium]
MKLYIIGGKAETGKDTFGSYLKEAYEANGKKACILRFSNPLREMCRNYFNWDGSNETKPRALLQKLGVEIIQEHLHKPSFLIDRLCEEIEILSSFFEVFIIVDARFPKEFDELQLLYKNSIKIHMIRPDHQCKLSILEQSHITEHALDNYHNFNYVITNKDNVNLKEEALKLFYKEEGANK